MEIDRREFEMMLSEYWAWSNNEVCEDYTIHFLRRIGYTDKEIKSLLDIRKDIIEFTYPETPKEYEDSLSFQE